MTDDAQSKDRRSRRYLLAVFWDAALGFWRKGAGSKAWILTATLITIVLVNLAIQYRINVWHRDMFNALEQKDANGVLFQSLVFLPLTFANVSLAVTALWARMTTQRSWRAWLNSEVLDRWLAGGRYYQLNLISGDHENPEYRVAEDLRVAVDAPVDFAVGIFTAITSALMFIGVLWFIGGTLTINVGSMTLEIPGFLVVAAVIYAGVASGSMVIIGRRFVVMAENKNQAEAEYRYALTRLRENGESIALLGGEDEERSGLETAFKLVLRRWREILRQYMRTTTVSQTSAAFVPVVPLLLCAPKYVAGEMTLGQVMQAASAFVTVQIAFNWVVDNYPRLAEWTASARRLASLLASIRRLERADRETINRIVHKEGGDAALRLRGLAVTLDDGSAVVNEADVTIAPGEKVLVVGESGVGKSTLVRAMSGLWPWGEGEIELRPNSKLFLMPQKPYIPLGTLRRAAAYPTAADTVDDELVRKTIEEVGLGHVADRLDEEGIVWEHILSGGEKQRLAFARLLIHRPDIVVMDEATAALDPPSQERLMQLVLERLPESTVISVGHRAELEAFHSRKLVLEYHPEGAKLVGDESLQGSFRLAARFLSRLWREKPEAPAA